MSSPGNTVLYLSGMVIFTSNRGAASPFLITGDTASGVVVVGCGSAVITIVAAPWLMFFGCMLISSLPSWFRSAFLVCLTLSVMLTGCEVIVSVTWSSVTLSIVILWVVVPSSVNVFTVPCFIVNSTDTYCVRSASNFLVKAVPPP